MENFVANIIDGIAYVILLLAGLLFFVSIASPYNAVAGGTAVWGGIAGVAYAISAINRRAQIAKLLSKMTKDR